MFLNNSFGKNLDILQRTMDVSVLRHQVIANNITNADTPNFKRSEVNFEAELARALDSEKRRPMRALMTDPRHIPFYQPTDYRSVQPMRILDYLSQTDNNGNNVDIEQEVMNAVENQMRYQLLSQVVANQFNRVNMVLR